MSEPRRRGAALAVAAGILLSRVSGLVRERVFAHFLGNSPAAGAFKAAQKIPNLLQNLFGEGVLSASFVTVYARLLAEGKEEEAGRVASVVASLLAVAVSGLVLVGVLVTRPLIDVIAPGFSGEQRELTIRLVQIMFSGCGLLVLSAWCLGVLNTHRRFFLSYVAPVLWNVAMIVALIVWGIHSARTSASEMHLVEIVAWAMVVGSGLQLAVQLPVAVPLVRRLRPSLDVSLPSVRKVLSNFAPVVLSRGVMQLSAYIDQVIASYLEPAVAAIGAVQQPSIVAAMAYAQILYTLPSSLFGMSVAAAELPEMSRELGTTDEVATRLRARLDDALGRIAFFVVPSTVTFIALGGVVAGMLFQTGAFHRNDSIVVWTILAGSSIGLLAGTQSNLLRNAFYALRDTRTPLAFAVARVVLTAALGWACALPLRRHFGWSASLAAAGLTASAGLAGWLEFLLLQRALVSRIGRVSVGFGKMCKLWIAALVGGGAGFALDRVLPLGHPILRGALILGAHGAIYGALTLALGVPEARAVLSRVRRRAAGK